MFVHSAEKLREETMELIRQLDEAILQGRKRFPNVSFEGLWNNEREIIHKGISRDCSSDNDTDSINIDYLPQEES